MLLFNCNHILLGNDDWIPWNVSKRVRYHSSSYTILHHRITEGDDYLMIFDNIEKNIPNDTNANGNIWSD